MKSDSRTCEAAPVVVGDGGGDSARVVVLVVVDVVVVVIVLRLWRARYVVSRLLLHS